MKKKNQVVLVTKNGMDQIDDFKKIDFKKNEEQNRLRYEELKKKEGFYAFEFKKI
jgi:hypothetical protein